MMYVIKYCLAATLIVLLICSCAAEKATEQPPQEPAEKPEATEIPTVAPAQPVGEMPQAAIERGVFMLPELHEYDPQQKVLMDQLVKIAQSDPVPVAVELAEPLQIAFMFPSLESSDAWARLNIAIRKRLDDVKVPYEVTEFLIGTGEHEQQMAQIEEVLAGDFDYVLIGPSEYHLQKENLERLAQSGPTLVMNSVYPFVDTYGTDKMPLTHTGFDHSVGANALCEWVINETGGEGTFALMRFLPSLVDEQRSDVFAQCVQENSNLELVDEYAADGKRDKAFVGANVVLSNHPELTMIHSGNTSIALGVLDALKEQGLVDQVLLNGWGGGADELTAIIAGELDVTAFRVNDDWGVSVAEAIKAHLEGQPIPVVIAPTIKIIDYRFSADDIALETESAFRYSGELDR